MNFLTSWVIIIIFWMTVYGEAILVTKEEESK
jgi:hypothetical protein